MSEGDLSIKSKRLEASNLEQILAKEAILFALLSALVYLTAYYFERSYLNYFGFSDVFVEIGIEKIAKAVAGITALALISINFLWIIPKKLVGFLAKVFVRYLSLLFLFGLTYLLFLGTGWSWWFVGFLLLSLAVSVWFLIVDYLDHKSGVSFSEIVNRQIDIELEARRHFVVSSFFDKLPILFFLYCMALLFLPSLLGSVAGGWYAKKDRNYSIFETNQQMHLLVTSNQFGFLAIPVDQISKYGDYVIVGAGQIIPFESISGREISFTNKISVLRAQESPDRESEKVTSQELGERMRQVWRTVFGEP